VKDVLPTHRRRKGQNGPKPYVVTGRETRPVTPREGPEKVKPRGEKPQRTLKVVNVKTKYTPEEKMKKGSRADAKSKRKRPRSGSAAHGGSIAIQHLLRPQQGKSIHQHIYKKGGR